MGDTPAVPALEYLFALVADVGEVVSLGLGPLGERRVVDILGGHFEGPRLRGKVLGGQDWQIARSDGVLDIDARYTIEADSGAKVRVVSQGYRHGPPEVMARLARGEDVDPADYFFRTVIRFETGDAGLAWLNKTLAVATAVRKARRVEIHAWRLL
ncbi:MAG TPA: DUF3237 domain-containing protein [Xanthobacteraceae bacterium]|nr:DUF3237 domain-containing protein [Xanthobacteraceae bacterium]